MLAWRAGTCAIVASTKCVETVSRHEYEKIHGEGTFPWVAKDCGQLLSVCTREDTWTPGIGADVSKVLGLIKDLMGVPVISTASTPVRRQCLLPLRSWKTEILYNEKSGRTVSQEYVTELLKKQYKPFIGRFWVTPRYPTFDASRDDTLVYHDCGRNKEKRVLSKFMDGDQAARMLLFASGGDYATTGRWRSRLAIITAPQDRCDELDRLYTLECAAPPS